VTLQVALVVPDGELWSGNARMVIAKTLDGDIGLLGSHPSVLGILVPGSVVEIRDPEDAGGAQEPIVRAAVLSGFLSVHDDRVSIMAREATLGSQVDRATVQSGLDAALSEGGPGGDEESAEVKYARALLRASGDGS
jgi:F-type H+-transporting ATPase subunit epsilon